MTLKTDEFLRRFLLHVLPSGFHRIRHYGLYGQCQATTETQPRQETAEVPNPQKRPTRPKRVMTTLKTGRRHSPAGTVGNH